ncbi:protein kinase, putative [Leishmania tarentolae]|uniref:Protein kinase, putative n=1 Tax=Leishmania tarentolae TaxID=5689 RepID=A0A640KG19_LEITA|nr:protein kinase, putative [Leishmania tarentolae]
MQCETGKATSHHVDVELAFTVSSPSTGEEEMCSAHASAGLHSFKDTLRIELPVMSSDQCTTPASSADCTGTGSPETAIFRASETAFSREIEECTPLSIEEHNAHQSAVALLQADIVQKSAGASSGRGTSRRLPSFIPTFSSLEPVGAELTKSPVSLFTSIRRKNRCNLTGSSGSLQRETSIEADRTSDGELDGTISYSGVVNRSSRNLEQHSTLATVIPQGASSALASPVRQQRCGATFGSPAPSQPTSSMSLGDQESEESGDSSGQGIEMDIVLRDASKIRGLRLTWLLYMLLVIVIILFVLVLVQITYETNRLLTQSATEAVQAQAVSLLNKLNMHQYTLEKLFDVTNESKIESFSNESVTHAVVRELICSSFYRAPVAFAMYGTTGELQWKVECKQYSPITIPVELPETIMPGSSLMRLVDYGKLTLAFRTFYTEGGGADTYVVMTEKDTLGRILIGDDMNDYRTATPYPVMVAFFLPLWNTTKLSMLFHTLTEGTRSYTNTPMSPSAAALTATFNSLCRTDSPYVWHTVLLPGNASENAKSPFSAVDWPTNITHRIPDPYFEHKRSWGQVSTASLCGVKCVSSKGEKCALDNPTSVWFLINYTLSHHEPLHTTVTIVGALSMMTVVIFSAVMFLVYLSITVPVNYLRYQLMRTVGSNEMATPWQQKIVRWTYRLWLGDLTSIARSIYILSLCFRLNKKYVPDHVLRNHAKQLYMRRRKFNFLEEVDLKEDTMLEQDTDSDNETESPLVGVRTGLPPSDARFLWHFSVGHDKDQAAHAASDSEVEPRISDSATLAEASLAYAPRPQMHTISHEVVVPCGRAAPAPRGAGLPHDTSLNVKAHGELDDMVAVQEASTMVIAPMAIPSSNDIMSIRREYETTVLCIRIPSVELAYLINYSGAVHQHRRLMRVLLHRIRRHKGALFHCSGDCLGAVWNAFEGCPNHAECAAVCAQEIANAFASCRSDGMHVGMVLHQGTLVCGTVEYSKTAFVTAFGEGPREALAVAELAASVKTLNVLVTEPVKQALAGLYDCNIVDVIKLPNSAHPLLLFELSGSRTPEISLNNTQLQTSMQAQFSIDYARAFAQFRNHEFSKALQSIQKLRAHISSRRAHLLRRLERLCLFFAAHPTALPRPYHRAFPVWVNYEAIAQAGLRNDPYLMTSQAESLTAHSMNRGVVYQGVPVLRNDMDCIRDFKQELQANMRRLVSPQKTARHQKSPIMDNSTTLSHGSSQSSLPMQVTPLPTLSSAGILLEISGDLTEPRSTTASAKPRYVDTQENVSEMSPPPPQRAPVETAAASCSIMDPPLGAVSAAALGPCGEATRHDGLERMSPAISTPHNAPFPSNHMTATQSIVNLPPVALADVPDVVNVSAALLQSAATHSDSIRSSAQADGASCSIIQSAGLSFQETDGRHGFFVGNETLPATIKAKNGTTYLRSTRILGRGSFGCVYLGMDAHSGRLVAIKFLPLPSDESGMEVIEAEVLILQRVNDTHVVQLLSYAFEGNTIVIFMECMLAGSLQNMISAFRTIPSSTARVFMRDVLRGLSKLHSMGIIHRDMKPQNVLLSFAGNCKISDFGASAWLQELVRRKSKGEVCGTPVYLAPEAARGSPEKESDIWSCGIMFLQMITGRLPYSPEQLPWVPPRWCTRSAAASRSQIYPTISTC